MTWLPIETTVAPENDPALLGQVREWLKLDTTDEDATVIGLVKAATAYIENYTGLRLFTQTVAMRADALADQLKLPTGPVQSITSFEYLDEVIATQDLDSSFYATAVLGDHPVIYLSDSDSWPTLYEGPASVIITAVVGYGGINDQPEDIRLALLMLCAHWFDNRTPVSNAAVNVVPYTVEALLEKYRVPVLA